MPATAEVRKWKVRSNKGMYWAEVNVVCGQLSWLGNASLKVSGPFALLQAVDGIIRISPERVSAVRLNTVISVKEVGVDDPRELELFFQQALQAKEGVEKMSRGNKNVGVFFNKFMACSRQKGDVERKLKKGKVSENKRIRLESELRDLSERRIPRLVAVLSRLS